MILNSPQCGGTHAVIQLLKAFGLRTSGRHRSGIWYPINKHKLHGGRHINKQFQPPLLPGQFITGHSGPFETKIPVFCNLRDPRNIAICQSRRNRSSSFLSCLKSDLTRKYFTKLIRHWDWRGDHVLRIWYEDLQEKSTELKIAEFCGVPWKQVATYGHGRTWSGIPSDYRTKFDEETHLVWDDVWFRVTNQSWQTWWAENGKRV